MSKFPEPISATISQDDLAEVRKVSKDLKKKRAKKKSTPKAKPLKGFLQSGILFIGDPSYMAGDLSQPGSELLESRDNPFLNWGKFTDSLGDQDISLPFPGAIDDSTSSGRGIAVQTNRLSGRFELSKKFDASGKLLQIVVKFYE